MATRRNKTPRTFTHGHRQGLDRAAEHYLRECYRTRKPVRGKDFARSLDLTPEYVSWLGAKILGGSLHRFLRRKQLEYGAVAAKDAAFHRRDRGAQRIRDAVDDAPLVRGSVRRGTSSISGA